MDCAHYVEHLQLSSNKATGESLNLDTELTCEVACPYCYCRKRTKERAASICKKLGLAKGVITGNTGPITWPRQRAVYRRNTLLLNSLTNDGIVREAEHIAKHLHRSQVSHDNLRFFGAGDATFNAIRLAFYLGVEGCQAWGFSKQAWLIRELAAMCDANALAGTLPARFVRPHFLLSVDRWTTPEQVAERIYAGHALNRCERVLAYMALKDETPASIRAKPYWRHVRTVLGYHATMVHTTVGIARECPKTSGKGITCQQCKRCMRARAEV